MSESPISVTYSLEEVLTRIEGKIDRLDDKIDERFEKLEERIGKLEVGQAKIEEKIDGLSKRIENQEFITRGVVVGLVLAFLAGFAKLFGIIGNP
jgi:predicted nuclease with TOPRIM domain